MRFTHGEFKKKSMTSMGYGGIKMGKIKKNA
jgi:hypothetical protein